MPPTLTASLLARPAAHSSRVVAAAYLDQVSRQLDAFLADETAGVHDLRVAIRRLRSWLRAFRPELEDSLRKKTRRRLRKLAHATNGVRDAEATIDWIGTQENFAARERAGVRYFVQRLETEREQAATDAREVLTRKLPSVVATLSKQLRHYSLRLDIDKSPRVATMAEVMRDVLSTHAERFARAIDRVESPDDATRIHRVRIAAKRARYLLETLHGPVAPRLVDALTSLQDDLGRSHDMHGTVGRIVRELGEVGARDARISALRLLNPDSPRERLRLAAVRPGLASLAMRARQVERDAYVRFRAEWDDDRVRRTIADVNTVGEEIAAHARHRRSNGDANRDTM